MSDYSATFPSQRPVFTQDFSQSGKIDPRATFSRASTGSYFGTAKHLSSENLLTPSTPDSSWTRARLTPTYSQTGPYAGANATLHTEQAITNTAYIGSANYVTVANTSYTYSVWVKQNTGSRNYYQLRVGGLGAGVPFVTYHLSGAGSIDEFGGSYLDSYSITAGPTGWYKLTMSITPTSASSSTYFFLGVGAPSGGELPSITGDTGNSFLVFGAQVSSTGESVLNETSTQIHREYAPTLQTAASGAARFEHSATDGQSMGCLIEGQTTNLNTYSKNGANSSGVYQYGLSGIVATPNAAVGPDGTLSATLHTSTDGGSAVAHEISTDLTGIAGSTAHTVSVYAKAAGYDTLVIYTGLAFSAFSTHNYGTFTLTGSGTAAASGGATGASIQSCGNGWYRCSVTATTDTSPTGMRVYYKPNQNAPYQGDDFSGLLLWGFQTEAQSFASSWVGDDSSSQLSRAADSLSVATADIGLTGGPVSYVAEVGAAKGYFPAVLSTTYGSNSFNEVAIQKLSASAGESTEYSYVGGDGSATTHSFSISGSGGSTVVAVASDTNRFAGVADGGTVNTDTAGALPEGIDTLYIGSFKNSYGHVNTNIKRVAVYSEALTDTNLQALTS